MRVYTKSTKATDKKTYNSEDLVSTRMTMSRMTINCLLIFLTIRKIIRIESDVFLPYSSLSKSLSNLNHLRNFKSMLRNPKLGF